MSKAILGVIKCEGCGNDAGIKKLSNSPLLYLHCKKCGCDRRSGKDLQAKWQAAIDNPGALPSQGEKVPSQGVTVMQNGDEWSPNHQTQKAHKTDIAEFNPDCDPESPEQNPGVSAKGVLTGAAVVAAIFGMLIKSVRG